MRKSLVISEQDNIAAVMENNRVAEFFVNRGELLLGDIYTATVENILPGIDAAFVNLGKDKMGFLHANDVPGQGPLKERLVPKQKLLVQITKEPTGHKGPRVSTAISLPGRFLVLVPEERGVSVSRRIAEARERARLKSVVGLIKPPGVGLIIRTEAKNIGEPELYEDFEQLWDRWQTVVSEGEASIGPSLIYRDQDLLYRVIRDAYSTDVYEVLVDTPDGQRRAEEFLSGWTGRQTQVVLHTGDEPILTAKGIDREIEFALSDRVELPAGGHLNIQPTEALTVIDVNSGRFTSSRTQAETVRRTNLEAAQEIPRQLRLRNIGGMVIVDFIDMESRKDQQQVLESFQRSLEDDRAKPQVGQLSDLGLVELTRRRQGQSLRELFTKHCTDCHGLGVVPTLEVGAADNRRLISTAPQSEEDSLKSRTASKRFSRQPGALRAASAAGGRVQSTLLDEGKAGDDSAVDEEILAQVPEDMLSSRRSRSGYGRFGMDTDSSSLSDESMEESGESVDLSDESMEESAESVDKEDTVAENLEYPLQTDDAHVDEDEFTELAVVESVESVESVEEDSDETTVEVEEPYSPFEAEPEPIAGVFRLKAKESFETQLQADESNSDDSPGVDASADGESPWLTESPSRQMELPLAESEGDESGIPAAAAIPAGSVESDGSEEER